MGDYEYIEILEIDQKPKTKVLAVINKKSRGCIGTIEWHGPWRQYCFMPKDNTVFSSGCLADIVDYIFMLRQQAKEARA